MLSFNLTQSHLPLLPSLFGPSSLNNICRYKYKEMDLYARGGMYRQFKGTSRNETKKKDNNPRSFEDVFSNPLKELIYLAGYAVELKIEGDKIQYQEQETANNRTYFKRGYFDERMWRKQQEKMRHMHHYEADGLQRNYRRRRHPYKDVYGDSFRDEFEQEYDEEGYGDYGRADKYTREFQQRSDSQLDWALKRQNKKNIYDVKRETLDNFKTNKDSFIRNKDRVARCLAEMNGIGRGGASLSIRDEWGSISATVQKKFGKYQEQYRKKIDNLATIEKPYELCSPLIVSKPNISAHDKMIKKMSILQSNDLILLFKLAIYYLIAPDRDCFLRDITAFQRSFEEVMRKLSSEDHSHTALIENLPYKQSSFYWQKIINCVRRIAGEDHYNDIHNRKIEFETDYAGTITNDTLKKLCNNCWLDNTITSAVIEYLKHIQGFNNYNEDNSYKAYIFNHSESYSFMNSTNNLNEDIPKYEKLVFLINIDNSHWITIAVYLCDSMIAVYDSLNYDTEKYCTQITNRLKKLGKKFRQPEEYNLSPRQNNLSDCGVFAIINLIMAADKQQREDSGDMYDYRNNFKPAIINEIRHSLFLLLCYLGYCKKNIMVPRKDYFDIMFRSTIYENIGSKLHKKKNKE